MRIKLGCVHCFMEGLEGPSVNNQYHKLYPQIFNESGVYRFRCDLGHDAIMLLTQPAKFEILAETATQAIVDGYYREAVASFAAALERFYEFYISALSIEHKISESDFRRAWSTVKQQSERQFGMYLGVFLRENGAAPPSLPDHYFTWRNDVVHKGKLPSEERACEFGQAVVDHVVPILVNMRARYPNALIALHVERHKEALRHVLEGERHAQAMSPMILDRMAEQGATGRTVASELALRRRRAKETLEQNMARLGVTR